MLSNKVVGGFAPIKDALQNIQVDLLGHLSTFEKKIISNQLNYYRKMINALNRLASISKKSLEHIEQMDRLTVEDTIDTNFSQELEQTMIKRGRLRGDVEALILKTLSTRRDLNKMLKNDNFREQISNKNNIEQVISEINNANRFSENIIKKGKTDWKFYEKWLCVDNGEFTLEKFKDVLANENEAEKFVETNINIITKNHWLLSSDLIY